MAAFGSHEVRLRTRDLSVGGCCVETQVRPPTGERVGLVLHVDGVPVGTWAEVAWSVASNNGRTPSYLWGLRFLELERESAARLAAYVDHCFAVDMLDEMLRGHSAAVALPIAPSFGAGDLDEVPTRIHRAPSQPHVSAPEFFPTTGGPAALSEATSEIDVESTLTSEVPHTHTVQVDLAELYRQMAQTSAPLPTATLASGWDMGGPEPVVAEAPAWSDAEGWNESPAWDAAVAEPAFGDPSGWDAPQPADLGWNEASAQSMPLQLEPVAWPGEAQPVPAHAPTTYEAQYEENAFAKALPFEAAQQEPQYPPQYVPQPQQYVPQQQYEAPQPYEAPHDPDAFDPSAFDPQALPAAPLEIALEPVPAPAPTITVELAPMTPADLLELKRKRIEEMLSSVPRRASAPESASKANAAKSDVPTDKQKRPRAPTGPQPAGLRELFDQALRELGRGEE